jgi:general stress protein 26
MQRVTDFAEIEAEFVRRAHAVVWCNGATVDAQGRPRSRILHPIWEGATGWITTRRGSPKVRQLAANPALSLAYIADAFRPIYVECRAEFVGERATVRRVWELCRTAPPSYGFDPAETWGDVEDPENGVLRLAPWRIELNDFVGTPETIVWRA